MLKTKKFLEPFPNYDNGLPYQQPRPTVCPHCGVSISPKLEGFTQLRLSKEVHFLVRLLCTDPDCGIAMYCVYSTAVGVRELQLLTVIPSHSSRVFEKHLVDLSPRFVKMYDEAYTAERNGHFDLASIGYRSALEFLIKDYAVKILNHSFEEVSSKSLDKAIKLYLPEVRMSQSADVVRIMGNDKTHYNQILNLDFDILKEYLEILIHFISINIRAINPPVVR